MIQFKVVQKRSRKLVVYHKSKSLTQLLFLPKDSKFMKYSRTKKIDPRRRDPDRVPKGKDPRRTQSACDYRTFKGQYEEWKSKYAIGDGDLNYKEKPNNDSFESDFRCRS